MLGEDLKNGITRLYYDEERTKIFKEFVFNKPHSNKTLFTKTGYNCTEYDVLGNEVRTTRRQIEYFESGEIRVEKHFVNDTIHGCQLKYFENGKKYSEVNMNMRFTTIVQKKWYENGNIQSEVNYSKGKLNGGGRSWFENGVLQSEMNYENDSIVGYQKMYNEKGDLILSGYK